MRVHHYIHRRLLAVALSLIPICVAGCKKEPQTVSEAISELEGSGDLPKLDRTDTVLGSDSNDNGVRDDVDAYIDAKSDTDTQKKSLRQLSVALGNVLVADTTNDMELRAAASKLNDGVNCVWRNYEASVAAEMVAEMRKVNINTRTRFNAYIKYNVARNGAVVQLPKGDTCVE